ncbi:unnamed protein product [Staurois parvus]|uniref:Uncharacterized protein n=1 Tax=Staurois parvus TaxID=386267 RepID=A0ABN9CVK6_9NEOB|nr:unnamed protein product [Staurois parvus]
MTSVWTVLIGPVLIICALPRKKKKIFSNTHQTEHVSSDTTQSVLSGDKRGTLEEGEHQRSHDQTVFFT